MINEGFFPAHKKEHPIYNALISYLKKQKVDDAKGCAQHDLFLYNTNFVSRVYITKEFEKKHGQVSVSLLNLVSVKRDELARKMEEMNVLLSDLLSELATLIGLLSQPTYSKLFIHYLMAYAEYKTNVDAAQSYEEAVKYTEPALLTLFINHQLTNRIDVILGALKKRNGMSTLLSEQASFETKLNLILDHTRCNSIYQEFESARKDLLELLQSESTFLEGIRENFITILRENAPSTTSIKNPG